MCLMADSSCFSERQEGRVVESAHVWGKEGEERKEKRGGRGEEGEDRKERRGGRGEEGEERKERRGREGERKEEGIDVAI